MPVHIPKNVLQLYFIQNSCFLFQVIAFLTWQKERNNLLNKELQLLLLVVRVIIVGYSKETHNICVHGVQEILKKAQRLAM